MLRWFNHRARGIQILLLLIPIVNFVFEIGNRWAKFIDRPKFRYLILAIFVTLGGFSMMFLLDIIWCLFFHHMIFNVLEEDAM